METIYTPAELATTLYNDLAPTYQGAELVTVVESLLDAEGELGIAARALIDQL